MQVFFPFGKFFFKIKIGIVRQTWRPIGWPLILMNDNQVVKMLKFMIMQLK